MTQDKIRAKIKRSGETYDHLPRDLQNTSRDGYIRGDLETFFNRGFTDSLDGTDKIDLKERQEHFKTKIKGHIEEKRQQFEQQHEVAKKRVTEARDGLKSAVDRFEKNMDEANLARLSRALEGLKQSIADPHTTTFFSAIATLWTFKFPSSRREEKRKRIESYIGQLKAGKAGLTPELLQEMEDFVRDSGDDAVLKKEDLQVAYGKEREATPEPIVSKEPSPQAAAPQTPEEVVSAKPSPIPPPPPPPPPPLPSELLSRKPASGHPAKRESSTPSLPSDRGALLAGIKEGIKLKTKAEREAEEKRKAEEGPKSKVVGNTEGDTDLASAIRKAMDKRRPSIKGEEEGEEEDSSWDDEEDMFVT